MKNLLSLIIILVSIPLLTAQEAPKYTYITEYKVGTPTTSTITEKSFKSIPAIILEQHNNDFAKKNISVLLNYFWETPYFSFWVNKENSNTFSINLWGGITRVPEMNSNGLALFVCHEIGHIIGGEPLSTAKNNQWSTVDHQADYFATSICLKKYFTNLYKNKELKLPKVSIESKKKCENKYLNNAEDILICKNIMNAVEVMAKVFNFIDPEIKKIEIFQTSLLPKVYDSYPTPQCRIESMRAGNFCAIENFPCKDKDNIKPSCWVQK